MKRTILLLAALATTLPAQALLIRADRDDAEYLEMGERYGSALALGAAGAGALIAPNWILATATGARALAGKGATLEIAGRRYAVAGVHPHPQARPGQPENLALVQLAEPVKGVEPTRIYRADNEAGKTVIYVGHGPTGRIGAPERKRDGKARAAVNTVERVSPFTLSVMVKPNDEASDLQGVLLPGEEGAPAFIEVQEHILLAGLYHGDVTVWNLFSRLSAFLPWIEGTMLTVEREAAAKLLGGE